MRQDIKRPLDCATSQADYSETAACESNNYFYDYSIAENDSPSMGRIAEILGHGAENAITTAEIKTICSFPSRRATRAEIARERANGVLICSCSRGLFLPSLNKEQRRQEIEQSLRTAEARAFNFLKTLKHFRQELEQCTGQEDLWNEQPQETIPEENL